MIRIHCSKCETIDIPKHTWHTGNLATFCRECFKEEDRDYAREYWRENSDRLNKRRRELRLERLEEFNKKRRENYQRKKYSLDEQYINNYSRP